MIRDNNKFMFQLQNKQTTVFQVNENTLFALHIPYSILHIFIFEMAEIKFSQKYFSHRNVVIIYEKP